MHIKRACFLFVLATMLVACQDPASAEKSACPESAQQYWKVFRDAVLKNDLQRVADLTQYPFRLSIGSLDFNRRDVYLDRKEFTATFPRFLSIDPGISGAHKTMKNYLEAESSIPTPSKACAPDGGLFRVGDWVFELKPAGWRFVQAYVGDEFKP